jgi:hypothetical protein
MKRLGLQLFALITVILVAERILGDSLPKYVRIVTYIVMGGMFAMYLQWLFINSKNIESEGEEKIHKFDDAHFYSLLVPILYVLGFCFIGLGVFNFLKAVPNIQAAIVLSIFGIVYMPMAFLIDRYKRKRLAF